MRGFYPGAKQDDTLPGDWDPAAGDEYVGVEDEYDFGRLVADLPSRQREVLDLIHRR